MRARLAVIAAVLLVAGCGSHTGRPEPDNSLTIPGAVVTSYDLPGEHGLQVHVRVRPDRVNAPWIAYIHGGSWHKGSSGSGPANALAAREVPRGYQFFGVDYRLSTEAAWPAQRLDVAAAVDWIRARSARFGLDPDAGVVIGASAGGQLAAVEASRGGWAGAISLAGAVDPRAALEAPNRGLGAAARALVGCSLRDCPSVWRDTRAISYVDPDMPPFLIEHAVGDATVPVSMSRDLAAALRSAGVEVTLDVVPGDLHYVIASPGVAARVDAFLDRVTDRG